MGLPVSRLCLADKLAFAITPAWLYIPMARWTGELAEYMERSKQRQAGDRSFTEEELRLLESGTPKDGCVACRATRCAGLRSIALSLLNVALRDVGHSSSRQRSELPNQYEK
jgi:hypothetical protein